MNTDPVAFFREDFPALFNEGVSQIKARAEEGDDKATARHADIAAAHGAVRVLLEGEGGGELFLSVTGGTMTALDAAPGDLPLRMAFAGPADAAKAALEEVEEAELITDKSPRRVARIASGEVEQMLSGHTLGFHATITDLPADPDEVTIRIAIGSGEPPADPKFSATVSWDDIEDVRDGEMTPQQLFGRLKIVGDASQAMALGMALMQRRR
ncbi:MAG: hypothetical protein AB8I08_06830 [Sandaracinaceae bacterium]